MFLCVDIVCASQVFYSVESAHISIRGSSDWASRMLEKIEMVIVRRSAIIAANWRIHTANLQSLI